MALARGRLGGGRFEFVRWQLVGDFARDAERGGDGQQAATDGGCTACTICTTCTSVPVVLLLRCTSGGGKGAGQLFQAGLRRLVQWCRHRARTGAPLAFGVSLHRFRSSVWQARPAWPVCAWAAGCSAPPPWP